MFDILKSIMAIILIIISSIHTICSEKKNNFQRKSLVFDFDILLFIFTCIFLIYTMISISDHNVLSNLQIAVIITAIPFATYINYNRLINTKKIKHLFSLVYVILFMPWLLYLIFKSKWIALLLFINISLLDQIADNSNIDI